MTPFSNKVTFQVCGLGLGHLFKGHGSTHSVCVCVCVCVFVCVCVCEVASVVSNSSLPSVPSVHGIL